MDRYLNNKYIRYILYLMAVMPIFIFRDFTPDNELRYLSIADEALRNGSFFTFTNHGMIYADKPPLYLWIVMLGKVLFGYHNMLFLSGFSFIPALVVVFVMDKWVGNVLSENERLTGQLMLMTSGFFIGTAIVLRMDMLMCMFIVLALYTFFRMYTGEGKPRDSWLFPIFIFMAIFSKGPMGLIVPLVSTVVFLILKKETKSIGKYWGWKTLVVLLAPLWGMVCRGLCRRRKFVSEQSALQPNREPRRQLVSPQGTILLLFHDDLVFAGSMVTLIDLDSLCRDQKTDGHNRSGKVFPGGRPLHICNLNYIQLKACGLHATCLSVFSLSPGAVA